jgi:hypothetical protein
MWSYFTIILISFFIGFVLGAARERVLNEKEQFKKK